MGGNKTIRLDDTLTLRGFKKPQLKIVEEMLRKTKPGDLTDDVLQGIREAVGTPLVAVPKVNRLIIERVNELLALRNGFQYGMQSNYS